jgi:hypothetical protein
MVKVSLRVGVRLCVRVRVSKNLVLWILLSSRTSSLDRNYPKN